MPQSSGSFFDEIVKELRRVPLAALPQVIAAIRSAATASGSSRASRSGPPMSGADIDRLADLVLALPAKNKLDDIQRAVVLHAVAVSDGNISAAARLLGVDRKAMERRYAKARRGK